MVLMASVILNAGWEGRSLGPASGVQELRPQPGPRQMVRLYHEADLGSGPSDAIHWVSD